MRASAYRVYDKSFKEDALKVLERADRTIWQVASDLGISPSTLRHWYKKEVAKKKKGTSRPSTNEKPAPAQGETLHEENARLKRELAAALKRNAELEEDRAILKKAAAFFAKESE